MKSEFAKLNVNDLLKSLIVAGLSSVIMLILPILQAGNLPSIYELKSAAVAGLASASAYLLKNLLTNSQDQILKPEKDAPAN